MISTRAAIGRWQDERGYPKTGFLDTAQHKALLDESAAARETGKSDHQDRRRGAGRVHHTRVVGGPIGVIGGAVHGVIGGLFRGDYGLVGPVGNKPVVVGALLEPNHLLLI